MVLNTKTYLFAFYGIGHHAANKICATLGISKNTKLSELSASKRDNLNAIISNLKKGSPGIDNELKKYAMLNIEKKILAKTYVGIRHKLKLPTRNQRTRPNGKTAKKQTHIKKW